MKNFWLRARSWLLTAFVALVVSWTCLAAGASVAINAVRQRYPWNGLVDIDYTVTSNMAIVVTAYDRVSGARLVPLSLSEAGSANALFATTGTHRLTWNAAADVSSFASTNVAVTLSSLPLYLVVDLATWKWTPLDAVPAGGWSGDYKTTKLVLRRVDPGVFREANVRTASVTQPFYVGVFELTQKQWTLVMGTSPSSASGDALPVENVSYDSIRGASDGASWPATNAVDAASFMGVLRAKTGLAFDLPSEAQWEFACRAGTTNLFNNGSNTMDDVGWYYDNATSMTHSVGLKAPNAWGLYDMHGNVWEWCLDWYATPLATNSVVDPVGAVSGKSRVVRGGSYLKSAAACASSNRFSGEPATYSAGALGLRVACAPAAALASTASFRLDTLASPRVAAASEAIAYSPIWDAASSCSVTVTAPDGTVSTLVSAATAEGSVVWTPPAATGLYTLVQTAGAASETAWFVQGGSAAVTVGGDAFTCRFVDGLAYLVATNGASSSGTLTVPDSILGCPVVGLDPGAFAGASANLSSVVLPASASGLSNAASSVSISGSLGAVSVSNGVFALSGAAMGNSATSSISFRTSGNGRLIFRWNVSCESISDYAACFCDGVLVAARSYTANTWLWTTNTVTDKANHLWTLSYAKDASGTDGQDAAWFSGLSWQPSVSLVVNNGSGSTTTNFAGDVIAIVADTPPSDHLFAGWLGDTATVARVSASSTTVTLPAHDIVLTANLHTNSWLVTVENGYVYDSTEHMPVSSAYFPAGTIDNVYAYAPPYGQLFAGWAGDTRWLHYPDMSYTEFYVPAKDLVFTAVYTNEIYTVSVTGGLVTDGVTTNSSIACIYGEGLTIIATNTASSGPHGDFTWVGDYAYALTDPSARTTTFTVSGSTSFAAAYEVVVTVNGGTGGGTFPSGTSQTISAPATKNGQVFAGWLPLDAPAAARLACQTTITVPESNYVLTASYAASVSCSAETSVRSGLYAGVIGSDTSSGGSIYELGIPSVTNRADYPVMADQALSSSFAGWGEKTNWIYWGQMQLAAGTYRFAECFDDIVLVMIGNKYILRSRPDKNGEAPEYGDFTAPSNGWYDVRFVFYNDSGLTGARVRSDWGNAAGLVFRDITSLSGAALTNYAAYASLSTGTYRTFESYDSGFFAAVAAFYGLDAGTVSGSGRTSALALTTNGVEFSGSALGDGKSVSLAVATSGNGSLSFSWLVSSEAGLDVFSCTTNGAIVVSGSGKGASWSSSTNYVTDGGSRSWIFTYTKNASGAFGEDAAWVKDIVWTAGATPPSTGRTNTIYSAVSVPYAWLDQYGLATGTTDADYENAATNTFANGYTAWASYLAGLDPTNAASIFIALISISNNVPVVTWNPNLGSARVYTVLGKTNLTDTVDWYSPTNSAMRFFKVEVEMP